MLLPAAGEEHLQTGGLEPGSSSFFREIFTRHTLTPLPYRL